MPAYRCESQANARYKRNNASRVAAALLAAGEVEIVRDASVASRPFDVFST